jgi:hypothetical protein
MRIEDCTVRVERRTAGGCLDLAIVFTQQHIGAIAKLLVTFAVPSCLLTWWISGGQTDLLPLSAAIFAFFSSLMSATLIATVGPQVFGVPISTSAGTAAVRQRFIAFLFMTALVRLAQFVLAFCLIVPAILPTAMLGHLNEVLFLERTPIKEVGRRLRNLTRGNGFSRNLSRLSGLMLFWAICSTGLFVLIDQLAAWVFNVEVFKGTMINGEDWFEAFAASVVDDRSVLLLLQVAIWIPFPIIRLAWFFCYLDKRIRNECWDLDLQFRAEATRLEEQTA